MNDTLLHIIESLIAFITGGGLVTLINIRSIRKKSQAETERIDSQNKTDHLEMTERILQKYQDLVLTRMHEWDKESRQRAATDNTKIIESIRILQEEIRKQQTDINDIKTYLNGGFKSFQSKTKITGPLPD